MANLRESGGYVEVRDSLDNMILKWDQKGHGYDFNGSATGTNFSPDPWNKVPNQVQTVITNCQTGHGFVKAGTGTMADDATTFCRGFQCIHLTTDGAGSALGATKTGLTAFDATGKRFVFYVKCSDWTRLNTLSFYLSSDGIVANYGILTGLNFANRTTDQLPVANEWVGISMPWGNLSGIVGAPARNALNSVKVLVADTGVGGSLDFWFNGLTLIPEPASAVLSLVFDDGWGSQYTQAKPKLDQYGYPGTAYIIRDLVDPVNDPNQANPAYMSLAQLNRMQDMNWQIGSHADTYVAHNTGFINLPINQVDQEMRGVKSWLVNNGFKGANDFAYPGGHWTPAMIPLVKQYFTTGRTLFPGSNEHRWPSLHSRMRARLVANTDAVATLTGLVTTAVTQKEWLIMVFHKIVTSPASADEYSIANFGSFIDSIPATGIPVMTISDALRSTA